MSQFIAHAFDFCGWMDADTRYGEKPTPHIYFRSRRKELLDTICAQMYANGIAERSIVEGPIGPENYRLRYDSPEALRFVFESVLLHSQVYGQYAKGALLLLDSIRDYETSEKSRALAPTLALALLQALPCHI